MELLSMKENDTAKMLTEGIIAYRKQDYTGSVKLFSQVIKDDPENALAFLSRGSAYLMLGKIAQAISDFNRTIALKPEYARAYHQRGLAREMMGDIANAYRDFDRALEIDPEFATAYQSRNCIVSPDCHLDLVRKNKDMVEHLAQMSLELFFKDTAAAFRV